MNPCTVAQPDPAKSESAGRGKTKAQVRAATGLPGRPNTGTPFQSASAKGRPGLTAIRQLETAGEIALVLPEE